MGGRYTFFLGSILSILLCGHITWAATPCKDYNRPNPLMDYVPQEIGIGDHLYTSLTTADCRVCHGTNLADRHHHSELALSQGLCTSCHGRKTTPPYVEIMPDCTAQGCHAGADLGPLDELETPPNGWHHYTLFSANDKCTACHDSDLIDHISNDAYLPPDYPPPYILPTPFNCENCHWEQPVADPNEWNNGDGPPYPTGNEGHPSTYDHNPSPGYNMYGTSTPTIPADEYHEYGRKIESNFNTHHMLFNGNVSTQCGLCHGHDPDDPSWDPANPELIRYCETCHNIATLHAIEPHVGTGSIEDPTAVNGWQAAGFHLPDTSNTDTTDVMPTNYIGFTANEQCVGCHDDSLLDDSPPDEALPLVPKVTDISPEIGAWAEITITGEHFGSGVTQDRSLLVKPTSGEDWSPISVSSWMDTQLQLTVPGNLEVGNYHFMVHTEVGDSNVVVFTVTNNEDSLIMTPGSGKCREIITVSGQSVPAQDIIDEILGEGVCRMVQIVGPSGTYTATAYGAWSTTDFKFRMGDVFEDLDHDYLRDLAEPLLRLCEGFSIGEYLIYLKDIYYEDTDGSSGYSHGDIIKKVETSGPLRFTLESGPALYAVNPRNIERSHYCSGDKLVNGVAKMYGSGFGSTQETGTVYIGTGPMYTSNAGLALERVIWGNNLIKVGVDVPPGAKGMTLYLWVEKDGQKTDASYGWPGIRILNSETCP